MMRRDEKNMSLKIDHITKKFGNFTALDDISLEIQDGEFLAILGPSGCGKTTLLRIIGGFEAPTEGCILKDGEMFSSKDENVPVEKRNLGHGVPVLRTLASHDRAGTCGVSVKQ